MYGFPKVFSTKKDFYNAVEDYPVETKKKLQELMDAAKIWVVTKDLSKASSGKNDATHKVILATTGDMDNLKQVYQQMELVDDENSEFNRMGWTTEEAAIFLARKEGK